jgi:hypothetical protein
LTLLTRVAGVWRVPSEAVLEPASGPGLASRSKAGPARQIGVSDASVPPTWCPTCRSPRTAHEPWCPTHGPFALCRSCGSAVSDHRRDCPTPHCDLFGLTITAHRYDCPSQAPYGYLATEAPFKSEGADTWSPRRLRKVIPMEFGFRCHICGGAWSDSRLIRAWRDARWHRTLHSQDPDYRSTDGQWGPARL